MEDQDFEQEDILEEEPEASEEEEIEDDSDEYVDQNPEPRPKGDLSVALRKEREAKKALQSQLSDFQKQLEKQQAVLERLGQPPQQQYDPEQYNNQLMDAWTENPAHVLQMYGQNISQHIMQQQAPLITSFAQMQLAQHPEFGELYKNEMVQQQVNQYLSNVIQRKGMVDLEDINGIVDHYSSLSRIFGGGAQPKPSSKGRDKLTSAVGGGKVKKQTASNAEEALKIANEMVQKLKPKDYVKWEKDNPEIALMASRAGWQQMIS